MPEPRPWPHRQSGRILRGYLPHGQKIYYRYLPNTRLVDELCLGERYAHVDAGLLFEYENYRGSFIDNWHGGPTGSLTELLKWVANAEQPELKYHLWMTGKTT